MALQVLFCVEPKGKQGSDIIYIKAVLNKFYGNLGNNVSIKFIPMNGKTNYASKTVKNKIKSFENQFNPSGNTIVVYCIDTDSVEIDANRLLEFEEIKEYCVHNKYKLIWFCRTIEEVFLGELVNNSSEKEKRAEAFGRKQGIMEICEEKLKSKRMSKSTSNILIELEEVFDEYSY